MRFLLLLTIGTQGCFFTPPPPSSLAGNERTITILQVPDTELQMFPVAVELDADASLQENATSAQNIAFELPNGDRLPCEIVAFDSSSGALEAWVQMPVLSASDHTVVLVYGDNVESTCTGGAMWPTAEYRAVWHLSEPMPTMVDDSTANHHRLVAGTTMPTQAPGILGGSLRIDDRDANGPDKVCSAAPTLDFGTDSFSYELWVRQDEYRGMYDVALANGGKSDGQPGYDFELGMDCWDAYVRDGTSFHRLTITRDATGVLGTWHHLAVTVDRGNQMATSYLDGAAIESEVLAINSVSGPDALCLGDATQPMVGNIDEVKLHATARSADWILAAYRNVHDPSAFLRVAPAH